MAAQLHIDETAIYHWLRGVARPKPEFAVAIRHIARAQSSSLTLEDIYGHSRQLRAADPSIRLRIERRKAACASR